MGVSNIATVTINVAAVNDAPVGVADSYTVGEDSTLNTTSGMPAGVLVNDTDAEGQALSAVFCGRTHQWCFGVGVQRHLHLHPEREFQRPGYVHLPALLMDWRKVRSPR